VTAVATGEAVRTHRSSESSGFAVAVVRSCGARAPYPDARLTDLATGAGAGGLWALITGNLILSGARHNVRGSD